MKIFLLPPCSQTKTGCACVAEGVLVQTFKVKQSSLCGLVLLPARPVKVLKTLKPFPVKFGKVLGGARFAGQSLC